MPDDPRLADLEILKALHQINFNRWEKRRNYEWLLSYAIWAALAGFIAVVVFGKESTFRLPAFSPYAFILPCLIIATIHGLYLFFIIDATLRDLEAQKIVERTMCELLGPLKRANADNFERQFLTTQRFRGFHRDIDGKWFGPRHGLFCQLFFTILLSIAAAWASSQIPKPLETAIPSIGPGGAYCQGCTQNLSAPPDAIESDIREDAVPRGGKKTGKRKK